MMSAMRALQRAPRHRRALTQPGWARLAVVAMALALGAIGSCHTVVTPRARALRPLRPLAPAGGAPRALRPARCALVAMRPDSIGVCDSAGDVPRRPELGRAPPAKLGPVRRALGALRALLARAWRGAWQRLCAAIADGVEEWRRSRRPEHIWLMRHGESQGNVNETLYSSIPDHLMDLTERGRAQARAAGRALKAHVGEEALQVYLSPYTRAVRTLGEVLSGGDFDTAKVVIREDPLLREQEFGNFQDVSVIKRSKQERRRYGRFWYRFDNGESGADVHGRAGDFLLTLFRQMDLNRERRKNYIILAHGLFIRLLAMRYMGWTVSQFEQVWNPTNCEMWRLDRSADGRYYLASAYRPREVEGPRGTEFVVEEGTFYYGPDRGGALPASMRRPRSSATSIVSDSDAVLVSEWQPPRPLTEDREGAGREEAPPPPPGAAAL